ncbi:hypothetical protein Droror1_Dr00011285 [Drosera rotundifolia]
MNAIKAMGMEGFKLESFNGSDYNAWKRKIVFGMQLFKMYHIVSSSKPIFTNLNSKETMEWAQGNEFGKSYILNYLANHLVDVYSKKDDAKEILDDLDLHYKADEKLSMSYFILDLRFEEDKEILIQVKELRSLSSNSRRKRWILGTPLSTSCRRYG